jgi:hypothetical protein
MAELKFNINEDPHFYFNYRKSHWWNFKLRRLERRLVKAFKNVNNTKFNVIAEYRPGRFDPTLKVDTTNCGITTEEVAEALGMLNDIKKEDEV